MDKNNFGLSKLTFFLYSHMYIKTVCMISRSSKRQMLIIGHTWMIYLQAKNVQKRNSALDQYKELSGGTCHHNFPRQEMQ